MNRWLQEELRNVEKNEPMWPGDSISHQNIKELTRLGLVARDHEGNILLTIAGRTYLHSERHQNAGVSPRTTEASI